MKLFEGKHKLKPKKYRDIVIIWGGKKYPAKIGATGKRRWKGETYPSAYRILYGKGKSKLKEKLQKTFISSYLKTLQNIKLTKKTGKEVLKITPISEKKLNSKFS